MPVNNQRRLAGRRRLKLFPHMVDELLVIIGMIGLIVKDSHPKIYRKACKCL